MAKILGLDLGTNSIGWAITERNENDYNLLDKGVDIFQDGVNHTKSGEEPMVKTRTKARALRRHYFRRRLRKIELLKVLIEYDLCPSLSDEELNLWRYRKIYPTNTDFLLWQRTDDNFDKNPYNDRYTVLTTKLDLSIKANRHMLGRALYHLTQRRGFLSNRKDKSDDADSGKVKSGINALNIAMNEYGCNYIGEYFYKLYCEGETIRKHYTSRIEHFEKEFEAICNKQKLDITLRNALYRALFFQRPLKSQKGLVGNCTFEKNKARCPISHPLFEEFRMWSFINNIKMCGPQDSEYRILSNEEVNTILPLFYRKSKPHFDFEDIAKTIAGKKGKYAHKHDKSGNEHIKFNYRMTQSVSGCPITASFKSIFEKSKDDNWVTNICSVYIKGDNKTESEIINDVWHALYSFDDNNKLQSWLEINLQLSPEDAKKLVAISIPGEYASLSLCAINKILPYLRRRYRYDEAVFLANLQSVVAENVWNNEEIRHKIIEQVYHTITNFSSADSTTKEKAIFQCLLECGLETDQFNEDKLYHPSMIETYQDAKENCHGILQLGSPRTSSIRNPMAMRTLFRLRALVNQLLRDREIDKDTIINIEMARELNSANKRRAIELMQRDNEKEHKRIADDIRTMFFNECGKHIEPSKDDILKFQLWEEQNRSCLYTGNQISICEFIGPNPVYDIEHTIPLSRGGDNSQENKTLCHCKFNRDIKRAKLPTELNNYNEIMARIESLGWEKKIKNLQLQIDRSKKPLANKEAKDKMIQKRHQLAMQLQYLQGKLKRFTMTEVPAGFSNRQGVDIGIIGRYARLYLNTIFKNIYTIKGTTTADFRKAWGLQDFDDKKSRANHAHHCIDAIVIACIGPREYQAWANYISSVEYSRWGTGKCTHMPKPWPTFTQDVKTIADELIVSHYTPNNMHKQSKKKLRVRGKIQYNADGKPIYIQGDTARGPLHMQTFYGAIKRDDEIKYVVRKTLDSLKVTDVDKIVDDAVRQCVKEAIAKEGFKEAISKPICFNKEKGVFIKKVRVIASGVKDPIHIKKHRDISRFEHKRHYHVANDSNYCMAVYEGHDKKGKLKRTVQIVSNLDAAKFFNGKNPIDQLVPNADSNNYPLRWLLRIGTMVLFYENSASELYECPKAELVKRLYKVSGLANDGRINFTFHQEARNQESISAECGNGISKVDVNIPVARLRLSPSGWNMLVEGFDFELTITGDIKFKRTLG